ncbi:MAG: aldo/keto reductase [Marinilabiliales bacterium]|nr:MAG: aldo/keto reductase [Marinilabiliales bacterium]
MEKRKLGKSGIEVTPIAFGAWAIGGWMWGGAEKNAAVKAIRKSVDLGITTIDTAPVYGFGLSEEITGEAVKGMRDKVQILTKFGLRWDGTRGKFFMATKDNSGNSIDLYGYSARDSVIEECENSLRRLGTDYIDLLQIHWPDPTTPVSETMEALNMLISQGKVRAAGVSNYDVPLMEEAAGVTVIASNQVPYSMLKRDIEKDVVPWCISNDVGILAYSPLQRGLLTGKFNPGHKFGEGDARGGLHWFRRENIVRVNEFLDKLRPLAEEKAATLSQLVLRWTIQQPGITCALAGARDPEQVSDNAGTLGFSLSDEELGFINMELNKLELLT